VKMAPQMVVLRARLMGFVTDWTSAHCWDGLKDCSKDNWTVHWWAQPLEYDAIEPRHCAMYYVKYHNFHHRIPNDFPRT
jgi:hypothetical protein